MSAPTPQEIITLAKELHATYRAAFKALAWPKGRKRNRGINNFGQHDHGWHKCHKKAYFLRRAVHVIRQRKGLRCLF